MRPNLGTFGERPRQIGSTNISELSVFFLLVDSCGFETELPQAGEFPSANLQTTAHFPTLIANSFLWGVTQMRVT
jgi:hypothetical protein